MALSCDPFDEDLERLLAGPEVRARLDELRSGAGGANRYCTRMPTWEPVGATRPAPRRKGMFTA